MQFLSPAKLRALDIGAWKELLEMPECVVAAADGSIGGLAAAALLFADYAVVDRGAILHLDLPVVWAGAAWRLGHAALRLYAQGAHAIAAERAVELGLCDEVVAGDPDRWIESWMLGRSEIALDTTALLIRNRGGDQAEREAFARLFAIGEPQEGLAAFLERRAPRFGGGWLA